MAEGLIHQTESILQNMDPITLREMDDVLFMQRTDTKYVLSSEDIPGILKEISDHYRALEIKEVRLQEYQTVYYDTPDFAMYHNHHNKRLNRYKIRVREYVSSRLAFLEVKFKNNRQETIKKRIRPALTTLDMVNGSGHFIQENSPYSPEDLKPALRNAFYRATLVHRELPERITIDLGLNYESVEDQKQIQLPGISIIEIKRDRGTEHSVMMKALRLRHIQPMGFSKYCMGTALMQPGVKTNLFRKRFRTLSKLEKNFEIN
jgi:hypothetical protein